MTGLNDTFFVPRDRDGTTRARTGTLRPAHGPVETPAFMPVGTAGTVKAISHEHLEMMGYRLILANTYHLLLRPGIETIQTFRGLHRFSTWSHNILTDSGGYQVFSLAKSRKITDAGVTFRSHIDGSAHNLTPETAVDTQTIIGSDIQMVLDVCTGPEEGRSGAEEALLTTSRWAQRAKEQWLSRRNEGYEGRLFGIVQGNFFDDLRTRSVQQTVALELPGIAIGGLSVGEPFRQFEHTLAHTAAQLPEELPRYVMGIGTPEYILSAIEHGIDMFDCVFPTRAGRTGTLFTANGRINIKNARWGHSDEPPDPNIDSFFGRSYSLGYLRHLFKANEILGAMLATEHNLKFLYWMVEQARRAIVDGRFQSFKADFLDRLNTKP